MEDRIFGHDVLHLLLEVGGALPVEELRARAAQAFGPDARFWNCHEQSFDFDGLLAFLGSRGKLEVRDGLARLGFVPACGH